MTRERALTVVFAILLSTMAVFGGPASPPLVPIADMSSVDPGSEVRVEGLLVDLWKRDDGSETLVLLDPRASATVKVFCSLGVRDQPSAYARIGDLMLVRGEVASKASVPAVFAESSEVVVVEAAEYVLTVAVLARSWFLFEGDRFRISGVLAFDPVSGCARLFDSSMRSSIELRCEGGISFMAEESVIVDGTLEFSSSEMALYIVAESISRSPTQQPFS